MDESEREGWLENVRGSQVRVTCTQFECHSKTFEIDDFVVKKHQKYK